MLVATTYIGSSFPPEKRGTALGFVTLFPVFPGVNAPLGGKLIDNTFQSTLNKGYANLFIGTTIIAFIGFIIFTIYLSRVIFLNELSNIDIKKFIDTFENLARIERHNQTVMGIKKVKLEFYLL